MSKIRTPGAERSERRTKKRWIALFIVGILGLGGAAYAYFTNNGSGEGEAQVGTSVALTINATITPGTGGIVPAGNPAVVEFSAVNSGEANQLVDTIQLVSVTAFSDALHTDDITGTGAGECDTDAFSMADVVQNQVVPGGTTALDDDGSLVFADDATNQDDCKDAYLVLAFTSN